MPQVQAATAFMHLKRGALGVGESHTSRHARAFVYELLESGLVKYLFIEAYERGYGDLIESAMDAKRGPAAPAKDKKEAAKQQRAKDNVYNHVLEPLKDLPDFNRSNPIPIATTVAQAIKRNVTVYCGDHQYMASSSPKYYGDFQTRHSAIRDTLKKATGINQGPVNAVSNETVGCLLLWGAAHFEDPEHSIDRYVLDLPYVMMDKDSLYDNLLNNVGDQRDRIQAQWLNLR